jgi:GAF domain-containing protein
LIYHGKEVGKLVVGPRHGERQLSGSDQNVIDLVAAPLAIVLHAQALTEALKISRERVIDAAEEERAESLAIELADQLRQSVEAVRQLAYGLRPAALDELGLVGALREEGSRYGPVKVIIQAPESMPALPSSVEVAAYRIAAEALASIKTRASEVGGACEAGPTAKGGRVTAILPLGAGR